MIVGDPRRPYICVPTMPFKVAVFFEASELGNVFVPSHESFAIKGWLVGPFWLESTILFFYSPLYENS